MLTGPGISGFPAARSPQARASAAPPGGIVGAVVALAGGGQALSAREGRAQRGLHPAGAEYRQQRNRHRNAQINGHRPPVTVIFRQQTGGDKRRGAPGQRGAQLVAEGDPGIAHIGAENLRAQGAEHRGYRRPQDAEGNDRRQHDAPAGAGVEQQEPRDDKQPQQHHAQGVHLLPTHLV